MPKEKPNLLIIQTDQLSCWALSCYDGKGVETTNIDRLAKKGTLFGNFFSNSAVCTPARGCFVTGRYPDSHGAYFNEISLNRNEITFAEILRKNSYRTGYSGKWHLDAEAGIPGWINPNRSMGFSDCRYMFNRGHYKQVIEHQNDLPKFSYPSDMNSIDEASYMTDWLADKTIEFIKDNRNSSFCYMVSIPDPHSPFSVRAPYNTMYDPDKMEIPETYFSQMRDEWADFPNDCIMNAPELEQLKEWKAQYYGEVKCIDDNVGKIINALEKEGLLENTIIVFTADHGEYMGEHGIMYKNVLYESAYRIPMIIRWPEKVKAGSKIDNVCSLVDFQQTILGLMDIPACGREEGEDLSPLLKGQTMQRDEIAYIDFCNNFRYGEPVQGGVGVFTHDYEMFLLKDCGNLLFDRKNDPQQINNIYNDPEHAGLISELTGKIKKHHNNFNRPMKEWLNRRSQRCSYNKGKSLA